MEQHPNGPERMTGDIEDWWDQRSKDYQDECQIPVDIHYGPSSPNEDELNLLGDVKGRAVLELGCGGAQCAVAFALRGAWVTAIDFSAEQLKFARKLASQHDVEIEFLQKDAKDLAPIPAASQDIVFSAFALMYVDDRPQAFREVWRVLKPNGVFVFSLDHPFFRKVDPQKLTIIESYHETGRAVDDLGELGQTVMYRYTIGDLHDALTQSGFVVQRVIEPDSRQRYPYDPWFGRWGVYIPKVLDMVPPTIIFKSVKPED
jgi:ubiquinone/menaquinone biosynthesis C-methylase UbiE